MNKTLHILSLILLLTGVTANTHAQTINGNIYGGGKLAQVDGSTAVTFNSGTLGTAETTNDIYGGGYGGEAKAAIPATAVYGKVTGAASVAINGGTIHGNVFGGGAGISGDSNDDHTGTNPHKLPYYMAGWVRQQTTVTMTGGDIYGNIYGGGDLANTGWYTDDDKPSQEYTNQSNVTMRLATAIYLTGGNVYGKVFGGGNGRKLNYQDYEGDEYRTWYPELIGSVCGSTLVSIGTKDGEGNVSGTAKIWNRIYGGGQTGKIYTTTASATINNDAANARTEDSSGSTNVELHSGSVGHNIFGGGLGDVVEIDDNPANDVVTSADVNGSTYVYFGHGTKLIWPSYFDGKQVQSQQAVMNGGEMYPQDGYIDDGHGFKRHSPNISHNLYGGGNEACTVGGNTYVYMTGAPVPDNLLEFLGSTYFTDALTHEGRPHFSSFGAGHGYHTKTKGEACSDVCLGSGDVMYNVIGGGLNGIVVGGCRVHVGSDARSTITNVYGGGYYAAVTGTKVDITKGHIKGDVFGGGLMGDVNANSKITKYPKTTNTTIGLKSGSTLGMEIPSGTVVRQYGPDNANLTIDGSVYGGNDVGGVVNGIAGLTIYGGTIKQNVYGAGNGDHIGYYEPGRGHFNDGVHGNYYPVDHSGDTGTGGNKGPKGNTYKGRPQTTGGVDLTLAGNDGTDRVKVLGQVFGGGNSCTIGKWDAELLKDPKYHGDPHLVRDDPAYFLGGGQLHIKLGSYVTIGQDNANVPAEYKNEDGENVSGLFMGNNGAHLATQSTAKDEYYYHHYYDKYTAKYWPGFAVFKDDGTPMNREEGLASFNAYLNNILVKSDDVTLSIADDATDIWLANFVGGGFRGSMKRKDSTAAFEYSLPSGVTIGNCVVGGAYNTDVVYRVFDTEDDMHTYKTQDGHYLYRTDIKAGWEKGKDYHHIEYAEDGTTITGIIRFYYDGGILSNNGTTDENITKLTLANAMNATDASKRRIFAGCFTSGTTQGNTVINYTGTGAPRIHGGGAYAHVEGNATVNINGGEAGDVYGGGSQADVNGSTKVNLFGGTIANAYGGGYGAKVGVNGATKDVEALVTGDATVTLGKKTSSDPDVYTASKVKGSIFGANNVNGTPKGHVKVHVLSTATCGQDNRNVTGNENNFDVKAVYGGGNQAAYIPTSNEEKTEVLIENCDNSIAYVYGGGNAAPVPATDVKIYGANAIDNAFAGGNGAGQSTDPSAPNYNPGADIGYLNYTRDEANKYGSGESRITIYGGTVNNVYGGSNTLGYIRTHAYVDVPESDCPCPLVLGNVHAGGNQAVMYCGGSVTLGCSEGAKIVYAGANQADIHGDIDITISSGTYEQVFGGNNTRGNIYGHINVNIDETGCWPIMIGELYGCGNNAAYSVYGYNNDGTCKTEGEKLYDDPTINVISCTGIGRIFGGGKGETATVYGNPTVSINTIKGRWAGQKVTPPYILNGDCERIENNGALTQIEDNVGTIGTVYGGGNQAAVNGNTTVNIGTLEQNSHLSGKDTTPHTVSVRITDDVFGGGRTAEVTGKATVKIGKDE